MMPFVPTLLSPARSLSVAKAAIQAGADAVYIGGPQFGARQAAGNSIEDIRELVNYAHRYDVQVLVTLNTLLTADERKEASRLAHALYEAQADALIIQDLNLLNEDLPPIRLHASTQCDNRTVEHIKQLRDKGFKRVVLARELSLDEIRTIHEAVPDIELEAFIHGALCVSYSGRCYLSEYLQDRSANRGCCAQPCRMQYDLLDKDLNEIKDDRGEPIHRRYLLSLQDMDRSAYISQLIDAGVSTFKIEGRLKDEDYVTNVTAYYRQRIDEVMKQKHLVARSDQHRFIFSFTPDPERTFHRGGTPYFLINRSRPMANHLTPKSTGKEIGVVIGRQKGYIDIVLHDGVILHNGDGLTVGDKGFAVNGIRPQTNGHTWVLPNSMPSILPTGPLFRNYDIEFEQLLKAERKVYVDICLEETDDGFRLTYTRVDNGQQAVGEYSCLHQPARDTDKARNTILTQLAKLGDTPFEKRNIHIQTKQTYFIPISQLNQWRRDLTEHL